MRKYLELVLLLLGIISIVVVLFFVNKKNTPEVQNQEEESALLDVPLKDRPFVSLTPTSDGHYLKLRIENMSKLGSSLDYELLYETKEKVTQGVPGTVDIKDKSFFETDLLLGSESSGKFRYDEGVEVGKLTLKFRNAEGKLLSKFETEFHMQKGVDTLTSIDGVLKIKLSKSSPKGTYFVTMQTVGLPSFNPANIVSGPYGIFASGRFQVENEVLESGAEIYRWDEESKSWSKDPISKTLDKLIIIGVSESN